MKKLSVKKYAVYTAVIALCIALDQLSKLLAARFLQPIPTKPLWEGVLHLTYVENKGAAFGMFSNARWVFMIISTAAIIALAIFIYGGMGENPLYIVSSLLIISGGIGNMIDRIFLGYVVDFIDFRLINFAVFNIADSFVCIGAGLLILALLKDLIEEAKKGSKGKSK